MGSLQDRNTEILTEAALRFEREVAEVKKMVVAQNAKIASLTAEIASLKQKAIMQAVADRLEATGHGGTA